MERNQIPLTHTDPISLHEEQRGRQLEIRGANPSDEVLNMMRIMSYSIIGSLISMSATLKLLSRGYYGKMDETVANSLKDLLSTTVGLIGMTEEWLGKTLSIDEGFEMGGIDPHLGTTGLSTISFRKSNREL